MAINWYPGHMHKAKQAMRTIMSQVDVVIEVLDARLPYSSENPMLSGIRGDKPCIKVLTKSDLADPVLTQQWQHTFEQV
ncbi:MAG TPA: ribosome biogenesis GTPase YlqF, partial [Gammaproteobacteria bacterium]|nr:ribosome biogenesis GTPase YlqF [Gammaproteobacteria bacterium]